MEKRLKKKEAKKVWDKVFGQKCPRCGRPTLKPWKDVEGETYYHCDYCNREFEKTKYGWFMFRADGRTQYVGEPNPKAKPLPEFEF